jgi:hypothetical protein
MARLYLFNCPECDHLMEIGATQAGQQLNCTACDKPFEAPKLGVLRQRPVTDESKTESLAKMDAKRRLFSGGLLLAVAMGVFGAFLYWYGSQLIFELDLEGRHQQWSQIVDEMSPEELLVQWKQMNYEAGLGEWQEQVFARYSTQGQNLQYVSYGLLGLSLVGVAMIIGSFLIRTN